MTTTIILIIYLIVGYVVAFFCLNAYDEDESVEKDVVPKWVVWTLITVLSLLWPIMLIKYFIERK